MIKILNGLSIKPPQLIMSASRATSAQTSIPGSWAATKLLYNNVVSDPGGTFNPSTSVFTPGAVGVYFVNLQVYLAGGSGVMCVGIRVNGGTYYWGPYISGSTSLGISCAITVPTTSESDYFEAYIQNGGTTASMQFDPASHFKVTRL